MNHPSEEQLALYCLGEAEDRAAVEEHVAACEACRASLDALKRVLAAVESAPVPERSADYGRRVWQRIEPQLGGRPGLDWRAWFRPQRLALTGAMATLIVAAYLAGVYGPGPRPPDSDTTPVADAGQVRERILLVAVGDHLERSQMVLVELVNTRPNGNVNIEYERERAEDLVAANRLYRQTAVNTGDAAVAGVLEELERVLLEIARSPADISSAELASLQRRIESKGILFKVRVIGSQVREKASVPGPAAGRS
jgi:hypothetical protein